MHTKTIMHGLKTLMLVAAIALLAPVSYAQSTQIPLSGEGLDNALTSENIIGKNVPDDVDSQDLLDRDGLISPQLLTIVNVIIGAGAIFFIVLLGVKMIFAQGDEGKMTEYKQQMMWFVIGLGVISAAEFLAFDILNPSQGNEGGGLLEGGQAIENLQGQTAKILSYIKYIVGGYVVMVGLLSGYRLVMRSSEDALEEEKQVIKSFVIGLAIIFMAETGVMLMSLPDVAVNASSDTVRQATSVWSRIGIEQITGLINFMLSFLVLGGVFMFVWAGIYYATNFGNEDQMSRAKGIMIGTVIAMVLVLSSYTIITLFVQ